MEQALVEDMAARLAAVDGVVAVSVRAVGHDDAFDPGAGAGPPDLDAPAPVGAAAGGLVFQVYRGGPVDTDGLRDLATRLTTRVTPITEPGAWGPWADGGGWLEVDGTPVDWVHRDLDRVEATWEACRVGDTGWEALVGHPVGMWRHALVAEVVLGRARVDPEGRLARLEAGARTYPEALRDVLVEVAGQARRVLRVGRDALVRGDVAQVAGAIVQAQALLVEGVYAHARRWTTHDVGSLWRAAALPGAGEDLARTVEVALSCLTPDPRDLEWCLDLVTVVTDETVDRMRG